LKASPKPNLTEESEAGARLNIHEAKGMAKLGFEDLDPKSLLNPSFVNGYWVSLWYRLRGKDPIRR
jgi:hypothetical protein